MRALWPSPQRAARNGGVVAVEIVGPWVANKGDALMLDAVVARLGPRAALAANPDLLVADGRFLRVRWRDQSASDVRRAITRRALRTTARAAAEGLAAELLPAAVAARRGVVRGDRVAGLLDCSGFAYGDEWSIRRPQKRVAYYGRLKRLGRPLVMLPQALGPFDTEPCASVSRLLLSQFDLVCARDATSEQHALALGIPADRVVRVPDITHLVEGRPPPDASAWRDRAAIIPNARMLDKATPDVATRYVDFVGDAIEQLRRRGVEPWLVLHESNDDDVVARIRARAGNLPLVDADPLTTKGILGASRLVVSSRYHGIVGALSSGTPAIGTSWTHKYAALFDAYGLGEFLLSPTDPPERMAEALDRLVDPATRTALAAQVAAKAAESRALVAAMWERVEALLSLDADRSPSASAASGDGASAPSASRRGGWVAGRRFGTPAGRTGRAGAARRS